MKIFKEAIIILIFVFIGDILAHDLHLPIPGSIIGMLLLVIFLLVTKLKVDHIESISNFILSNLAFFYIPAAVGIIKSFGILKDTWFQIIIVCLVSTVVMLSVTSVLIQLFTRRKEVNE